jgi:hypothetical protein
VLEAFVSGSVGKLQTTFRYTQLMRCEAGLNPQLSTKTAAANCHSWT